METYRITKTTMGKGAHITSEIIVTSENENDANDIYYMIWNATLGNPKEIVTRLFVEVKGLNGNYWSMKQLLINF